MGATNDERLLTRLSIQLRKVPGVRAIVLGGSRASGTATPQSDYDLGLYYEANDPLDVDSLTTTIAAFDDTGPAARVTPIGGRGPWINGGGWLTVEGKRVDCFIATWVARAQSSASAARVILSDITNRGIHMPSCRRSIWVRSRIVARCGTRAPSWKRSRRRRFPTRSRCVRA